MFDPTGAAHPLPSSMVISLASCFPSSGTNVATDGSGYTLSVGVSRFQTQPSGQIYDAAGNQVTFFLSGGGGKAGSTTVTDPDGATVTNAVAQDGITHTYTDTLNEVTLTTGNGTYSYTDHTGTTQQTFTVTSTSFHQKTVFGCSGVGDIDAPTVYFPTSISIPDGTVISISYEQTPGFGGNYTTGRISTITLPYGGTITYGYADSLGHNGIDCNSNVVPILTRTVTDNNGNTGTWKYVNSNSSSTPGNFTVVATDPVNNQTVYHFSGEYQTFADSYQGGCPTSITGCNGGGAEIQTVTTCYNGNFSNGLAGCETPAAIPTAPITQKDVYTWVGIIPQSLTETVYDCKAVNPCYGNVTEVKQYDYGAPFPPSGAYLSDTVIVYNSGSNCGTVNQFIHDRPCSITVTGPSGQLSQAKYTYNTGGHPTQTQSWVSGGTYLTSAATYGTNGASAGVLSSVMDVNGATTTYSNFVCNGMLPQITTLPQISGEPFQMSRSQTWDCNGAVVTAATDVNGNPTAYLYNDPLWHQTEVDYPDGGVTQTSYNSTATPPNVHVQRLKDSGSDWVVTQTNFDGIGRPVQQQILSDPSGTNNIDTKYDNSGRVARISNRYRTTADYTYGYTNYLYDALGRLQTVQNVSKNGTIVSTRSIAYTGRAMKTTNERNISEIQQYDALGRLVSVCTGINAATQANGATISACGQDIAANGFLASYAYNQSGNSLDVTFTTQSRHYSYDGLGRLASETNPEYGNTSGGTTTYSYDGAGQQGDLYQRSTLAPNQPKTGTARVTTTYSFDVLHRPTGVSYSGGYTTPSMSYTYDVSDPNWNVSGLANLKGNLASAWVGTNMSSLFNYDAMGRTLDEWQCTPHVSCTSSGSIHATGQYDYLGDSTQVQVGQNDPVAYTYDTTPHVLHINDPSNANFHYMYNILYNGLELVRNENIGDGNQITLLYNQFGGLTSLSAVNGSTTTYNLGVGYTLDHNVNSVSDSVNGNWTHTYSSAFPERLSSSTCTTTSPAVCPNGATSESHSYSYDQFGNRWGQTALNGGPSFAYTFNANNQITNMSVVYDAAGNMIADEKQNTYTYDDENRLVTVGGPNYSIGYSFDAFNRRTEITNPSGYKDFFFDVLGRMSYQGGTEGTFSRVYFGQSQIATINSNGTFYYYGDQAGTLRVNTSSNGTVSSICTSLAFGDFLNCTNQTNDRANFTGQWTDPDGLTSFPARAYSTVQGRWASPDPLGIGAADLASTQTWNRYGYVDNNPLTFVDPLGTKKEPVFEISAGWYISAMSAGAFFDGGFVFGMSSGSGEYNLDGAAAPGTVTSQLISSGAAVNTGSLPVSSVEFDPTSDVNYVHYAGMTDAEAEAAGLPAYILPDLIAQNEPPAGLPSQSGQPAKNVPSVVPVVQKAPSKPNTPPMWENCSSYRDGSGAGSTLYQLCMNTPDNPWSNCVRGTLLHQYVQNGSPLDLSIYLFWDHPKDFASCAIQ